MPSRTYLQSYDDPLLGLSSINLLYVLDKLSQVEHLPIHGQVEERSSEEHQSFQ